MEKETSSPGGDKLTYLLVALAIAFLAFTIGYNCLN